LWSDPGAIQNGSFQSHHKNKSRGLLLLQLFCHCFVDGNNTHIVDFHDNIYSSSKTEYNCSERDITLNTRRGIPYLQKTMYYFVHYKDLLTTTFMKIFRRFPTTFPRFLKITEDCRGLSRKIRKCFDHTTTNLSLRVKLDISEVIDIFTSDDMENTPPGSRMWFRINFMSGVFSSETPVST